MSLVVACVKPVPLGEPGLAKGQVVTEGLAWGLPASERRVVAAAKVAAVALRADLVAVAVGPSPAQAGVREALALGARRAVFVAVEQRLDALLTAQALSAAIRRLGTPQAVFAGEASADAGQGLVGPMVAEALGLELLMGVETLRVDAAGLHATRTVGAEELRFLAKPPLVVTVSSRFHPAGHATSWGVGEAYDLPLQTLSLSDLGVAGAEPAVVGTGLTRAEPPRSEAERFEGDVDEAARQLARRLRALGVAR